MPLNTADRKIFTKTSGGTVVEISGVKADEVNAFTAGQSGTVATLTETATVAVDLALGNNFTLTLTGTATDRRRTYKCGGWSEWFNLCYSRCNWWAHIRLEYSVEVGWWYCAYPEHGW